MNNYWAFGEMRASNDVADDRAALRARLADDGYLLLRGLIAPGKLWQLRLQVLDVLVRHGWIDDGPDTALGIPVAKPVREGEDAYFDAYDEVQRLEAFHALAHDPPLLAVVQRVLDDTAFPHPLKVARLVFPSSPEISTPPHQDHLNNQGTADLLAAWVPLGDCPREQGSLAILRGSHRFGVLPLAFHLGAGNRQAVLSDKVRDACTWVTTDMGAGDVVLFPALTVHASLNNSLFGMRLSVDFRYQREGEDLTDLVLEPHFGRLTWEEIYKGWESDELQYYWRDKRWHLVPYDRSPFEESAPTDEEVMALANFDLLRDLRHAHRTS